MSADADDAPPGGEQRGGEFSPGSWRRRLRHGIVPRIIVALTLIVAVTSAVSAFLDLRNQERLLLDQMTASAEQLSDAIIKATWHAMLEDRRDAAYAIMESVARQSGIEKIRIFNKEGRVVFSTGTDRGTLVDKKAEACDLCHAAEQPLVTVDAPTRSRVFRRDDGSGVMGMITPVYNEPSCSSGPCHAHPEEVRVLGVLDVGMSLDRLDHERARLRDQAVNRTLVEVGLVSLFIVVFVGRFVGAPVRRLARAVQALGATDLSRPIDIKAPFELGELLRSFEGMRERLAGAFGELAAATADLEHKVEERTAQLHSAQERLVETERMASLGRLAATVANDMGASGTAAPEADGRDAGAGSGPFTLSDVSRLIERLADLRRVWAGGGMRDPAQGQDEFHGIVSRSPAMHRIFALIAEVASLRSTVLIEGESGTGKELVARAIHAAGSRASRPFVMVSCAALPETLLESELFGYEAGAFTGACGRKKGKFELASGGTLLLDEIGDVSPKLQVDLLRVLQERRFFRVGGTEEVKVDVRFIAATNRPLRAAVREGRFRNDLFHRLNVIRIAVPPLRERVEDIPLLAEHFACRTAADLGKVFTGITQDAMDLLQRHPWPGNVRELENAVERAMITCRTGELTREDFDFLVAEDCAPLPWMPPADLPLRKVEEEVIRAVLRRTGGNVKEAAAILGIDRSTLYDKMRRYGVER